ncbi:adenylate/guanylate cyclase domain-containing protein [Leisingera aquaemixtae]|uniref:Adenylate/guanylate cyclase domain-containing protein n=1 Tax=Leisingera aquaemixtae TaxID=1396826 RepID=A0ABY5WLN6_9RHOB|nr:adenylate/guanylate cyclase domain-containing protein [Leisingera aquaemixtae]UWQ42420.1 adenylate/guanylate cyclase domain-containing protein [Leisingera aquaemixtae]
MASALWQGNWITRTRIITGLVLFTYAFFHFLNIGLGLLSPDWMEAFQDARQLITRSVLGGLILYTALILHAGLALWSLARRRTLRMRPAAALQMLLGFLIPLQLLSHLAYTRYSHEIYGVNDEMAYVIVLMWASPEAWQQSALLLAVWIHGCIGLHYWLRLTRWWRRLIPWMAGVAVLIPGFALAGFLTEGRRIHGLFVEGSQRPALMEDFNWPSREVFAELLLTDSRWFTAFLLLLGLAAAAHVLNRLLRRRRAVRIRYAFGPEIRAERGLTLLQMSQAGGVQHTSLCGGKGRCTTCRVVVEEGGDTLPPPAPPEARSLARVQAPANMRLACQIRPEAPLTVTRMFRPDGRKTRAHASQGSEQQLAVLFLDMRGFTARTAGQLPYDVVFLLNRFFDAIVPAVTRAGGTVDKYLGDGLLALFEAATPARSAEAALEAATAIGTALQDFNARLAADGEPQIRIGIGIHLGQLVLGEIGSAGHAPRTIIGGSVNTASRLEAKTKDLGIELLVSARVLQAAGYPLDRFPLQEFQLRGVSRPLAALAVEQAAALPRLLAKEQG